MYNNNCSPRLITCKYLSIYLAEIVKRPSSSALLRHCVYQQAAIYPLVLFLCAHNQIASRYQHVLRSFVYFHSHR
jgi:hypothetical protein